MTDGLNYEFNNGILKLITKKEDIYARGVPYENDNYPLDDGLPNLRWWHYTSGMIFSKQKYKYGLFEIRFKLPVGKGLWPAYWLYGDNPNEEFDIFEYKGETPNKIHIDMHCPTSNCDNFGGWVTATGNFSDSFNDMMGEWGPNASFWYLNGHEFAIWLGNLNYQANIIAGVGVANEAPCPFSPGPDNSTSFPTAYEIDFIRIWTRLDCEQTITISNYNQAPTDPTVITGQNINITNLSLNSNQSLNLIATNEIVIGPDSHVSGEFHAKIVDCPGPQKNMINNQNSGDTLKIISSIVPDNINNKQATATIENPPQLYAKIYPNPSQGKVTIEFVGTIDRNIKIELFNSNGQIVFTKDNILENKIDIDTSPLSNGTYLLKGTLGINSVTEKIILN
jgi:hypothetical protein